MKKNKATIHDISKSLGIDSSTVSRALNNSPRVSKKTKKKIVDKALELGYQRNSLASKLRTNRSNTIGVIVPRISRHFFSTVISGIEETAFDAGYDVMICQSLENLNREKKLIETLLSNRVDGILISISMETTSYEHLENYMKQGYPLVFFDRPCKVKENSNVIIDDYKGSFEATEHLIKMGRKNIAYFSGPQSIELYIRRLNGYKGALKKYGIEVRPEYIFESRLMKEDGVLMSEKIKKLNQIDAVCSANDIAAIGAMQALKSSGVKIPEEISFVGFSNEPVSEVMEPSLSTVNQHDFDMGKSSASLLIKQVELIPEKRKIENLILNPELIIRNSSKE